MISTNSKFNAIRLAIWTIIVHAIVSTLHGAAHQVMGVSLSPLQTIYVAVLITIAPLVSGILIWRKVEKLGALVLVCSMVGALIFGVYNHFLAISPDHVSHLEYTTNKTWVSIFQATAVLIAFIEAFGIWIGIRLLRETRT